MIAERIYNDETAADIGITQQQYDNRKRVLDEYLATTGGTFDGKGYLTWLSTALAGDRGAGTIATPETQSGLRIARVTKRRPCPKCGGGKIR
jgi:hypothetical protein